MIWLSADSHYWHKNLCGPTLSTWKTGYRNFSSLEEMNEVLLDNLNSKVGEDDVLYFLGDFAMGNRSKIPELRAKIHCKNIHLIFGNHDRAIRKYYRECFTTCQDSLSIFHKGVRIVLSHFPHDVWEDNEKGSIHLFGHCHGNYKDVKGRRMDVGVDTNNFYPYSLDEAVEICSGKEMYLPDHHRRENNV